MSKSFGLAILLLVSGAYGQDELSTIPQSVSVTGNLASGYSNFIVRATFTVDSPATTTCNWIYGGDLDTTSFYTALGCFDRTSTNATISCTVDSSNNVVTDLTFLNAPTTTVNVNMRCAVSGSPVVDLVRQYSVTDCPISTSEGLSDDLNVTVTSGGGAVYNSTGEFMCEDGELVDSSGISVSSNSIATICQADATWTDQTNRTCFMSTTPTTQSSTTATTTSSNVSTSATDSGTSSNNSSSGTTTISASVVTTTSSTTTTEKTRDGLSGGEIAAIVIVVPLGSVLLWFIASLIYPCIGCCLMEWFTNLSGKMPCCKEIPKNNGKISPAHNSDENVEMMSKPA